MSFLARSVRRSIVTQRALRSSHLHLPNHYHGAALSLLRDSVEINISFAPRHFSSTSSSPQDRLSKTLYRQLLRWCQDTADDIPLSSYVPPVTTMSPIVDAGALKRLSEGSDNHDDAFIRHLLPPNSLFEDSMMTVPLRKASDIRNFFRAVYRMNGSSSTDLSDEVRKQRVSMAFETLKSVNELTVALKDIKEQREKHLNREGVDLFIGQVVQHKAERWRGIVLGWEIMQPSDQLSSLTTKDYSSLQEGATIEEGEEEGGSNKRVRYTMLVDSGDAHLLGGSRQVAQGNSGFPVAYSSDLELLSDTNLCRIRGHQVAKYFDRFDATSKCFVPNESRQYVYPLDEAHLETTEQEAVAAVARDEIGGQIVRAIQSFATRLERRILDETSSAETRGLNVIVDFQHRLSRLASGDVMTDEDRLTKVEITNDLLATLHLRWFLNLSSELAEHLWQRRTSKEAISGLQFRLGDIVRHTKYDFRGVIVAFDPKPSVDVSQWDGLGHVDNPNEKPFYHVIPDQADCIKAFGGERSFRYVCEENLELCPRQKTLIDVDLDLDWEIDTHEARYVPPYDLRFKYGEDLDDDNATENCLNSLHNEIGDLNLAQRGLGVMDDEIEEMGESLSTDVLLKFLKLSNNMDTAIVVEETMKELWKTHPDPELRTRLDSGIYDLLRGNREKALIAFQELTIDDPEYAEAWNKASTCYFMLGDMQASLEAADKTLALIPNHFQVINGLGLIQYETRRYKMAAGSFRQSLQLDPWSPVSSRLAACLDLLHGSDLEDEQGAAEGTAPYE